MSFENFLRRGLLMRFPLGLACLLVASLVACATPTVVSGAGPEEVSAQSRRATLETGPLYAAKAKTSKKSRGSPPRPKENGETEATKRGRQEHKDWDPGEGFKKEVKLPSGKRADAVNHETQEVKELKPDNPRAIKRGERQVEEYRRELEEAEGGSWKGTVETYKSGDKP
jgi:Restriction endonuclease fold toxin 9